MLSIIYRLGRSPWRLWYPQVQDTLRPSEWVRVGTRERERSGSSAPLCTRPDAYVLIHRSRYQHGRYRRQSKCGHEVCVCVAYCPETPPFLQGIESNEAMSMYHWRCGLLNVTCKRLDKTKIQALVTFMSKTLMLLSSELLRIYLPEGWKMTLRTQFSWLLKVIKQIPYRQQQRCDGMRW